MGSDFHFRGKLAELGMPGVKLVLPLRYIREFRVRIGKRVVRMFFNHDQRAHPRMNIATDIDVRGALNFIGQLVAFFHGHVKLFAGLTMNVDIMGGVVGAGDAHHFAGPAKRDARHILSAILVKGWWHSSFRLFPLVNIQMHNDIFEKFFAVHKNALV